MANSIGDVTATVRAQISGYMDAMRQGAQGTANLENAALGLGTSLEAVGDSLGLLEGFLQGVAEELQAQQAASLAATDANFRYGEGLRAISERVALLGKGLAFAATQQESTLKLQGAERGLQSALARGNLTLKERIMLEEQLMRVQVLLGGDSQVIATSFERVASSGPRVRTGLNMIRTSMVALASRVTATSTSFGTFLSGLLLMSTGTATVTGVAAGLAAVAIGYGLIKKRAEEAAKAVVEARDKILQSLPAPVQSIDQQLKALSDQFAQVQKDRREFLERVASQQGVGAGSVARGLSAASGVPIGIRLDDKQREELRKFDTALASIIQRRTEIGSLNRELTILADPLKKDREAAEKLGAVWTDKVMTPWERSQALLTEINTLFRQGAIDQQTWGRASQLIMGEYLKATEASRQGTLRMLEAQREQRAELQKYIDALISRFRSAGEVARDEMAKVNDAMRDGVLTAEQGAELLRKIREAMVSSSKQTGEQLDDMVKIWRRTILRGVEEVTRALLDGILRQQKSFGQVLKDVIISAIEEAIVAIVKLKLGQKILDALGLGKEKGGGVDILGLAKDIGVGILTGGFSAAAVPTPSVAALSTPAPAPTLQVQVHVPAHNPNPLMMARDRQWQEAIKESLRVAESQGWRARRA